LVGSLFAVMDAQTGRSVLSGGTAGQDAV